MVFKCVLKTHSDEAETWNGFITNLSEYGSFYELRIESRSKILVLFGKTSYGYFACIPDFGVGCHLADLRDRFWNEEQLSHILGPVDGLTVANALYTLADRMIE